MNKKTPLGNAVAQYNGIIDTQLKVIEQLKAEVAALMTTPTSRLLRASRVENDRLKDELEHLRADTKKVAKLQAENARICKAGDAMLKTLDWSDSGVHSSCEAENAWNAAKDGKQSE